MGALLGLFQLCQKLSFLTATDRNLQFVFFQIAQQQTKVPESGQLQATKTCVLAASTYQLTQTIDCMGTRFGEFSEYK